MIKIIRIGPQPDKGLRDSGAQLRRSLTLSRLRASHFAARGRARR
jgi:hypothetical protein